MKTLCASLLILLNGVPALHAQNLLSTEFELKDGGIVDTAAHQDATTHPSSQRMWLAQGRVRAAMDLLNADRVTREDRYFDGVQPRLLPPMPGATSGWENVEHVELDEAHAKLYTLTDHTLYREDVSNPSVPIFEAAFSLSNLPIDSGPCTCLRVWSPTETVVLLTFKKVVTLSSTPSGIALLGWTTQAVPFMDSLVGNPASITPSKVKKLQRMTLAQDVDNRVLAYVIGQCEGYGVVRPGPGLLVLCDLDATGGFVHPTFDNNPNLLLTNFVFFDPMRSPGAAAPYTDWSARDVAVLRETVGTAQQQSVFLACGRLEQVQRFDATAAWTAGLTQLTPRIDIDPPSGTYAGHDIQRVIVHPTDPKDLLALTLNGQAWLYDRALGLKNGTAPEMFRDILGDVAPVVRPAAQPTLWTTPTVGMDYQVKVIDVTQPAPGVPMTLVHQKPWPYHSDGGVAIPEYDSIYVPTTGNILRYAKSGSSWVLDPTSAQPNDIGNGPNEPGGTEHVFLGRDVQASGDHRLYACDGFGGFYEYKLHPSTHNPLPPTHIAVPAPSAVSPTWSGIPSNWAGIDHYNNDLAMVRIGTTTWMLTDVALLVVAPGLTTTEAALLAYKFDPLTDTWSYQTAGVFTTATTTGIFANTDVISVSSDATPVAFVNYPNGFVSIPLGTLLNPTPSLTVASNIDTYAAGAGFRRCGGLASRRFRVFACLSTPAAGQTAPVQAQVNMYSYSPTTGVVGTLLQSLTDQNLYCQSNGAIAAQPPGTCTVTGTAVASLGRAFRARYHSTSATCGALYVCSEPLLLELAYDQVSDQLSYSGHWRGDYTGALQDVNRYDFGAGYRLLVIKDSESFALVTPTTFSCP